MWQTEMSLDQLNLEACGTEGDVASWNTLQEKGSSTRTQQDFPSCAGKISSIYNTLALAEHFSLKIKF